MGTDKLALPLGGSTVLGELLSRVPRSVPVAVVGPARPDLGGRSVLATREDPPGGGPAAAVDAGLRALAAAEWTSGAATPAPPPEIAVVCAGDAPWSPLAVPALVAALRAGPPEVRCAVAVDGGGRRQVLLAAHRLHPLRAHLSTARDSGVAGRSARWLVGAGALEVPLPEELLADVDTPDQLLEARRRS